jgi:hypothetical protein
VAFAHIEARNADGDELKFDAAESSVLTKSGSRLEADTDLWPFENWPADSGTDQYFYRSLLGYVADEKLHEGGLSQPLP